MLRALDIRDMLIIDRAELAFQPGLNVLTGETGAGKSILLDALGFVLGWRGRAELVRPGADKGEVTAVFDLAADHPARAVLADAGLEAEDELILRRVVGPDGRKTAFLNDRRASSEVLRALSDCLVEVHGQHDDRGLVDVRGHRAVLDRFAGNGAARDRCRSQWRALSVAEAELAKHEARLAELKAEEEFLRHAGKELADLNPQAGEDAALDTRRRLLKAGEKTRQDVMRAAGALGHEGAEGGMQDARRWLEDVAHTLPDEAAPVLDAVSRAITELGEAQAGVERLADALLVSPGELEETEERLFAIRALARKHGCQPDDLAGVREGVDARLAALDTGAGDVEALLADRDRAARDYDQAASDLTDTRTKAAASLARAMTKELKPLKLDRAEFTVDISGADDGPEGRDTVQFVVATNPGAPAGPLNRIASGGELSRFLLALKVCLAGDDAVQTMIFDEIDRGVGGATADAVGRRLAALAASGQVIVVTHSPQVAALARHHWRVEKTAKGAALTRVVELDDGARVEEIARMLSGDKVTTEARAAAGALIDSGVGA